MNRKKRLLLSLVVTLSLCVGPVFAGHPDTESAPYKKTDAWVQGGEEVKIRTKVKVKVGTANVRRGPALDYKREFRLKKGDIATLKGTKNEWYHIELDDGREGWAREDLFFASVHTQGETADIATLSKQDDPDPSMGNQITSSAPSKTVLSKAMTAENPGAPIAGIKTETSLISINYIDVDIRKALSTLAMERELNIATASGVSGKISVHLYEVTVEQALGAIVNAGGFTYHNEGNVYYVYKSKETRDPQAVRLQLRVFKLKYGEVTKVQEILDALPETRVVKVHEATKTIVVEDTPENIQKIEAIIRYWDKKPKQVMIEAKILEISLTDQMLLGVNWEKILGDVRLGTGGFSRATLPSTAAVTPVPSSGMGIFGNVITGAGSNHKFAAALDALRTKTRVNTLSTPKIMAVHGETARVQVGGQRGYRETTLTGTGMAAETIKFIPTGTILEITPFVDEENNVLLNVKPSIKSADIQEGIPVVTTTEVSTWLLAKNGETVLIGGLIQDTKSNTKNMIPCLGSIPGAGALFGKTDQQDTKKELVVLITPLIFDAESKKEQQQAIEKTRNIEEKFKKGPPPEHKRFFEFLFPPMEGVGK